MTDWIKQWVPVHIDGSDVESIRSACASYETMLIAVLDSILERYERNFAYPFVDTKLDVITGLDFTPGEDVRRDFKSRRVVFGWIQGRGLEALAGHADWLTSSGFLPESARRERVERIHRMLADVLETMESLRDRNHGRMAFMMRPDGQPIGLNDSGDLEPTKLDPRELTFSDLFYAKGLYAAARTLRFDAVQMEARAYFQAVVDRIDTGTLLNDQQSFDPRNPVRAIPDRLGQGPFMLGLFGLSLLLETTGEPSWLEHGCCFIRHILDHHVIESPSGSLEKHDFIEAVDRAGNPWVEDDGAILCDPGHALECVGAIARFLSVARLCADGKIPVALVEQCRSVLPSVLLHVFDLAWNQRAGGLCKSYDLVHRRPRNNDMPWWSLPETIRATALLLDVFPELQQAENLRATLAGCSNAFLSRYVNPSAHLMAYQTRNAQGQPIDTIPATPDADPGYHTGLASIDFLRVFQR